MIEELSLGAKLLSFGRKYWTYIVAILAVAALIGWAVHAHSNAVKRVHDAAYQQGFADAQAAQKSAQAKADAQATQINSKIKEQSDAKAAAINSDTVDVRLHGPGKATCPRLAPAPAGPGGPVPPAGAGDAAVDQVPSVGGQQLIALPFDDAVRFAGQCDLNRDEAARWRLSDEQQRATAQASQPEQSK